MGFDDLLKFGLVLGKALFEETQVSKSGKSEYFQEELNSSCEDLEWKDDIQLLKEFHEKYADDWGRGLFQMDTGNRMDPEFMAYMKVFEKRNIVRLDVCCDECDRTLGHRMAPRDFEIIENIYDLTNGYCSCNCGEIRGWEIRRGMDDESTIWPERY